ncbi:MAG: hypothetical protein ACNS63_02905 [Candidatus Nitrospinota bacterium M3_3B_026]
MPLRLIVLLGALLAGLLYITVLNTALLPVTLYPGLELGLPLAVIIMGAFSLGVLAVMALYFYDALADSLSGLKKSASTKRAQRVKSLYEAGAERLMMQRRRAAEKLFKKALAHDPDHVPSLAALGRMRREDGAVSEAIKLHSKARGLDEDNLSVMFELAEDYAAAEQFANAVSVLEKTRTLAGRSLPPLVRIRDIYLRTRHFPGALATQREIVSLAPWDRADEERRMLAALTYENALSDLAGGRLSEAESGFKAVLRGDDQFVPAYLKLAEMDERQGRRKDAVKILEKGFRVTGSIVILMALVSLLTSAGDIDKAIAELKWARGVLPGEDVIRLFLAEAHLRKADYAAARREIDSLDGRLSGMTLFHLVEGKARRGENNIDLALDSLEEAYRCELATFFHFTCSACGALSPEYAGRCRTCGAWNTLTPIMY